MIITCEKCSTRFNLDDSFIKKSGSKVRCSMCKHIFTAYPASNDPNLDSEISDDLHLETNFSDDPSFDESDDFQMEDSDFALEETDESESELSLDDSELSDLELPGSEPSDSELSDSELSDSELSDSELSDSELSIDDTELSIEDSDLEIAPLEMEPEGIASDAEFSFDDNEFEIDVQEPSDKPSDEPSDEFEFEEDDTSDTFEMDEGEFEFEEDGLEFEPMDEEDEISDLNVGDEAPELEFADSEEPISESEDSNFSDEDEFELEFDVDDNSDVDDNYRDEPSDSFEGAKLEVETDSPDEDVMSSLEETDDEMLPKITPEEDFSEYDEVLDQETEPDTKTDKEESILIDDTKEEAAPILGKKESLLEPRHVTRRRKKKPLVGTPILILLLIFLLIIGAYIASIMTGYKIPYLSDIKIPYIEQYLKKPEPVVSEAKPVPNQKSVNGRFVTNTTAGTLFVITGSVENPASIPYSHIKILGTLITKGKTEAKTKTAYCGNIVSEEMLKTENISDINKILMTEAGNLNANVGVKPGASIPFMVVFSDLPEKLQNFTVKVTTFDK